MSVTKAIIPAAGLGTRMFSATKAIPKDMLPLLDMPIIEHIVRDAVYAGIDDILIVINRGKEAIINHFSQIEFVNNELIKKGKSKELLRVEKLSQLANIQFIYQEELKGLGDAILLGRTFAADDPVAIMLGDNILESYTERPVLRELIDVYKEHEASCIAIQEVPKEAVFKYGVMSGKPVSDRLFLTSEWVEKPLPAEAPSNYVVAGQYIFTPQIFEWLTLTKPGKNGEIQITDAMNQMAKKNEVFALLFDGKRHDMGNFLSYTKTIIDFALKDDGMRDELSEWLKERK